MKEWTVRNLETGAVQMTGFRCETAEQAIEEYVSISLAGTRTNSTPMNRSGTINFKGGMI